MCQSHFENEDDFSDYEGVNTANKNVVRISEVVHSTISTLLKNKDRVKEAVDVYIGFNAIIPS